MTLKCLSNHLHFYLMFYSILNIFSKCPSMAASAMGHPCDTCHHLSRLVTVGLQKATSVHLGLKQLKWIKTPSLTQETPKEPKEIPEVKPKKPNMRKKNNLKWFIFCLMGRGNSKIFQGLDKYWKLRKMRALKSSDIPFLPLVSHFIMYFCQSFVFYYTSKSLIHECLSMFYVM